MDEHTFPVTMNFNDTEVYGVLKVVGISDELLSQCTLNPAYVEHPDGRIEILTFSIVTNKKKSHDTETSS